MKKIYGCYKCKTVNPDIEEVDEETFLCGVCREDGLITMQTALDVFRELYDLGLLETDSNGDIILGSEDAIITSSMGYDDDFDGKIH